MVLIVVMGVSGSGKTTMASALAQRLSLPFVEGDSLHPAENIRKMSAGIALTDDDRWPWLQKIGETLASSDLEGGLVVSCSALKRIYRDHLRSAAGVPILFIYMDGSRQLLQSRMAARSEHFMPSSLLESQLNTIEPPNEDESAIRIDCAWPLEKALDQATEFISSRIEAHPRP